jgi:hypothetical protein
VINEVRCCVECTMALFKGDFVEIVGRLRVTTGDYMFHKRISGMNKGRI